MICNRKELIKHILSLILVIEVRQTVTTTGLTLSGLL